MTAGLGRQQMRGMVKSQGETGSPVCGVGHDLPPIQRKKIAWEQRYILLKRPREKKG